VVTDVLLSEGSDHVAVLMERAVEIAMSAAVLRSHLVEWIVTVNVLAIAPGTVNEEQATVDNAAAEDGILWLVHKLIRFAFCVY
jgi:hypothetical protein